MKTRAIAWVRGSVLCQPVWLLALLLSLAACWFHVYFAFHAGGLWRDEVNTVNVAGRHSLAEMANDSFPIMMPLLVRAWTALGLGQSDQALRLLGAFVGLGLLSALWVAGWAGKRSPPALCLALFGLNTTVIIYGDSLRAFGLGSLLVVLLIAAMCAFLQEPSWARTWLLAATAIFSVQALFQNVVFVGSVCAGGWVVCWLRRAWSDASKILLVALIAAASLLPYWSRIVPLAEAAPATGITTLRTEFRPSIAFGSLGSAAGFPLAHYVWVWGLLAFTVVAFAAAAVLADSSAPKRTTAELEVRELAVFAAATLLCGFGGFACFLWWAALRTQPWYFLPPMALATVCFELGLSGLRRHTFAAFMVFVAVTGLLAVPFTWRGVHWRFTNVDLLTRWLAAQAAPGDFVLVTPWNRGISFARYFHGETPWETVPPLDDHSTHRYDLLQKQTQTSEVMRPVFQRIVATLAAGNRVWVVGAMDLPEIRANVPTDLDPPPRPHTGWSAGPYVRRWTSQAAQLIMNHSLQFVEVPLPSPQAINPNEALGLWKAEGWESAPIAPVPQR